MILKIYRKDCTNTVNLIISSWQTLLKPVLQAIAKKWICWGKNPQQGREFECAAS